MSRMGLFFALWGRFIRKFSERRGETGPRPSQTGPDSIYSQESFGGFWPELSLGCPGEQDSENVRELFMQAGLMHQLTQQVLVLGGVKLGYYPPEEESKNPKAVGGSKCEFQRFLAKGRRAFAVFVQFIAHGPYADSQALRRVGAVTQAMV